MCSTCHLLDGVTDQGLFWQGVLLTVSNPLSIVFWGSVFSAQVVQNKLNKMQLLLFGLGCVLSTLVFLSFVSLLGMVLKSFIPKTAIAVLNSAVGLILIFFGIKLLIRKNTGSLSVQNIITITGETEKKDTSER